MRGDMSNGPAGTTDSQIAGRARREQHNIAVANLPGLLTLVQFLDVLSPWTALALLGRVNAA